MSLHNDPNYQIPALVAALKHHCLTHDTPSQLADSFRTGWVAAIAAATAHPMAWAIFAENGNCRMWTQNKGHADVAAKDTGLPLTALYAAPQPAVQAQDARQPLTDAQVSHIIELFSCGDGNGHDVHGIARAIEAVHGIT